MTNAYKYKKKALRETLSKIMPEGQSGKLYLRSVDWPQDIHIHNYTNGVDEDTAKSSNILKFGSTGFKFLFFFI